MRIFLISVLILVGVLPSDARAGAEPIIAAAPDWVEKVQIPAASPKLSEQPFQSLLFTVQTSHGRDGSIGDVKGAIAIVDNAVPELGAANTPLWMKTYNLALRRGRVLSMAGRNAEARAEYDAALGAVDARLKQLPPPRGPVLGGVAVRKAKIDLLLLMGRGPEAIAVADEALAVQPSHAAMLTVRCKAWLRASAQLAKARQDCDAARRNDPADRDALYASGLTSLKSNDWARAAGEFEALTKELPTAPAALFGRGVVRLRRGEKANGAADIELARSLSAEIEAEFGEIGIRP